MELIVGSLQQLVVTRWSVSTEETGVSTGMSRHDKCPRSEIAYLFWGKNMYQFQLESFVTGKSMLYVFYLLRALHRLKIERGEALCINLFYQ